MNVELLKIGQIVGMHYSTKMYSDTLIIYAIGAPIPPDSGTLPDAPFLLRFGTDIFVPDYLGFSRSDGKFTPKNCINTFLLLFKAFKKGCLAKNAYEKLTIKLKYKRIIFIGRSFGGTFIPLLPRFNPGIKEIAIFAPVVDSKSCGSIKGEETNEDFLKSMKYDGYKHLYRGILDKVWIDNLENKDGLSPMDNVRYLENTKLFIAHGKRDKCVHYSKSKKYYEKILEVFPKRKKQFKLKLYSKGKHDFTTTNKASRDFLKWLNL